MQILDMATLQDWKTALASGVKIEALLGLDKDAGQQTATSTSSKVSTTDDNQSKDRSEQLDLHVKTENGGVLEFQWSSPSLTTICPEYNSEPSSAPTMIVSPPSIPVNQILGPCFIDISDQHGGKDSDATHGTGNKPPQPD
ncbi:uncharacterized protein [Amphiura filiformis]|uniref:uncharacterized protein n=1 Tax=Amphiura filiformis TaxID=82378 RepID=UPI003B2162A6